MEKRAGSSWDATTTATGTHSGRSESLALDKVPSFQLHTHQHQWVSKSTLTARSPWSNNYIPASSSGPTPSAKLRQLEVSLNSAFDTYREMYFEGGISSVYLWDLDEEDSSREMSFAGVVLVKKSVYGCDIPSNYIYRVTWTDNLALTTPSDVPSAPTGSWDSLHVFECQERGRSAKYKLTSTVMLVLESKTGAGEEQGDGEGKGGVTLSGSMTRQVSVGSCASICSIRNPRSLSALSATFSLI